MTLDHIIIEFDKGLRTVLAEAQSVRPFPDRDKTEHPLTPEEKRHAAALMRINHSGEVCAQALYNGQALTARNPATEAALREASHKKPNTSPGARNASTNWAATRVCSTHSGTPARSR